MKRFDCLVVHDFGHLAKGVRIESTACSNGIGKAGAPRVPAIFSIPRGFASKVAILWQVIRFPSLFIWHCLDVSSFVSAICTRRGSNLQSYDPKS